jgi:hypothetical protein
MYDLGAASVLMQLTADKVSYASTSQSFEAFANAMTSRFRFQFGAAIPFDDVPRHLRMTQGGFELPAGEARGIAWRTNVCVKAEMLWLTLPIFLTAAAALLMLWTIGSTWRERHARPVWKGNLLPLLFHAGKIDAERKENLPW